MTTFDLAEVRGFTADLDARMNQCDNGEGLECANLDGTLRHYAVLCCEFHEQAMGTRHFLWTSRFRLLRLGHRFAAVVIGRGVPRVFQFCAKREKFMG